jgi:hypothetical protein
MLSNFVQDFRKAQSLFPVTIVFGANVIVEHHCVDSDLSFKVTRPYVGYISLSDLLRSIFLIISWALRSKSSLLRTRPPYNARPLLAT